MLTQTTDSMRQHTSAYVSIRQHTSAYVSIRQQADDGQHAPAYVADALVQAKAAWTSSLRFSYLVKAADAKAGFIRMLTYADVC